MYAVVKINDNWDGVKVTGHPTKKGAIDYLQRDWEELYNSELNNPEVQIDEENSFHEESFAQIEFETGPGVVWMLTPIIL